MASSSADIGALPADRVPAVIARSMKLRKAGDLGRALATVEPLVREFPDRADVWHAIGGVYIDLRMRERGTTALARAVQLDSASTSVAKSLAQQILKRQPMRRDSIGEVMMFLRDAGFSPGTIVDVGVNTGTPGPYEFFPDAHFLMLEPLRESVPFM